MLVTQGIAPEMIMKEKEPDKIKQCTNPQCQKRYLESKGFYKVNGYYRNVCKECFDKKRKQSKLEKREYAYKNHLYVEVDPGSTSGIYRCTRCNVLMKKVAGKKQGEWHHLFYVGGMWTAQSPQCILSTERQRSLTRQTNQL